MASTEAKIEFVYDVTKIVKGILKIRNGDKEGHPLISHNSTYDKKQTYNRILLDFRRGMVRVVDGKIFDRDILPLELSKDEEKDEKKNEDLKGAEFQMLETHFSKFETMFGAKMVDGEVVYKIDEYGKKEVVYKSEYFYQYEPQSFVSIAAAEIFYPILGDDYDLYNPGFSNGKVCHFWKESIDGKENLCMLMVDDGFTINCNRTSENPYRLDLPGAIMIEIKVPISVIEKAQPITEQHITQALVSSTELFNLLQANPKIISLRYCDDDMKKEEVKKSLELVLSENGSREPLPNLGHKIREPNFKETIPEEVVNKRIKLLSVQEAKQGGDDGIDSEELNEEAFPYLDPLVGMLDSQPSMAEFELSDSETEEVDLERGKTPLRSEDSLSESDSDKIPSSNDLSIELQTSSDSGENEVRKTHSASEITEYKLEEIELSESELEEVKQYRALTPFFPERELTRAKSPFSSEKKPKQDNGIYLFFPNLGENSNPNFKEGRITITDHAPERENVSNGLFFNKSL